MNILGGLKYALLNYGIIVQRDADKDFLYDLAPPIGRDQHRVVDLLGYIQFDTVDEIYPSEQDDNPSKRPFDIEFEFSEDVTYIHLAGDTFFKVSRPSYFLILQIQLNDGLFVDHFFPGNIGEVVYYFEESLYPYSDVALPAVDQETGLEFNYPGKEPYKRVSVVLGGPGWYQSTGTLLNFALSIPLSPISEFARLIGISHRGPATAKISTWLEVPKLRGETIWPGATFPSHIFDF